MPYVATAAQFDAGTVNVPLCSPDPRPQPVTDSKTYCMPEPSGVLGMTELNAYVCCVAAW